MAISPLPTPPSRDDPANFAARGDAFLGALPDFATELNDALPTINEAIPASEIAVALVNYKGDYNSATTYLVGQSVTYNGDRYLSKKTNLNITPVDGADWYALQATSETVFESILNQSSAITLTAVQSGYLLVSGTQAININLPDATTLTGRTYVIKNIGSFVMFVYDASGNYLFPLSPSVCIEIWASDVSTTAGQWASQTLPPDYFSISTSLFSSAAPITFDNKGFARISATQQICTYYRNTQSGYKVYTTIVNQSTGTPSLNTSYELIDVGSCTIPSIAMCSATTGVLTWHNDSLGYRGCVVTVSGTTISYGAIVTIDPSTSFYGYAKCKNLSATTAFTSYMAGSTAILGNVLTISGTTLSVGTQATICTTDGNDYYLGVGSATFAGVVRTATSNLWARGITISGSTFTVGTDTNIVSNVSNGDITGCDLASTKFAIFHYDTTSSAMVVRTVTWSGTTPTGNAAQTIYAGQSYSKMIGCYSATSGVVAYNKGGGQMYFKGWTLSTNTFTIGTEVSGVFTFTTTYQYNSLLGFGTPYVGTPTAATYMLHQQYSNGMNIQTLTISGTTITANASKYAVPTADYIDILYSPKTICSLSTTRAILITSGFGDVGAVTLTASLISYTNEVPVVLQSVNIGAVNSNYYSAIASLSSTQAIVTYTSTTGTVVTNAITMSGDTISVGSQAEISSTTTCTTNAVCRLSATTAICFWRNSSSSARSVILTVSGSSVTAATYAEVSAADILGPQVEALTSTKAIVVYGSSGIKSNILTISGTTISVGLQNVIVAPQTSYLYLAVASATKCVLGTGGGTASHNANLVVLTINGNVITYATPAMIPYITQGCRIAMLGSNRGIISYASNSYAIRYFVISNNVAVFSNALTLNTTYITPLTAPNTATPSAATVATATYDGYGISVNKIFSIGALN